MQKKKILLFADWYQPGFKAGGPIRSCVNFTQHMQEHYSIHIFTSDRDLGDEQPYPNIPADSWTGPRGPDSETPDTTGPDTRIYYCSPERLSLKTIREQITLIRPDFIYLNSMFSTRFTIYPLLLSLRMPAGRSLILSPRGMLRQSALRFKPFKKKLYLFLFRLLGLQRSIHFLASDETEQNDIQAHFGKNARVSLIPNLPASLAGRPVATEKIPGQLSMIFVGRIHPIKNLHYLLGVLATGSGPVKLSIIGSLEDGNYWQKCQEQISRLPEAVHVQYLGEMANDQLPAIIRKHHIFILPTRGENFGHAIFEALSLGKPVLISDQTPWRNLSQVRAGWDLPLDRPESFVDSIDKARAWDQHEYDQWSSGAFAVAAKKADNKQNLEKYRQLFS